MKKRVIRFTALALAVCLFTGCSIANTTGGESEADRKNVSGEAVSGSVAAEDDGILAGRNQNFQENSNCRYTIAEDDSYIVQFNRAGKQKKKIRIRFDIDAIEWVTDKWFYYVTDRGDLWRMPVKKTEEGEQLLTEKKEKVLEGCGEVQYATDLYVIADVWINEILVLCKYNCRTGKRTELVTVKEEDDEAQVLWGSGYYPLMWQGKLFFERRDKLCLLNPEDGEVSPLHTFGSSEGDWEDTYILDHFVLKGDELYYTTVETENLYRLNCSTKKSECVMERKECQKEVRRLLYEDMDIEDIWCELMWLDQDRIYFAFDICWTEKDKTTGKKSACYKEELFSASVSDLTQLRHEDKLMDYLDKKSTVKKGSDVTANEILGGSDGVIAAEYHVYKQEKVCESRYVIYDIRTGEIRETAGKDMLENYEELLY